MKTPSVPAGVDNNAITQVTQQVTAPCRRRPAAAIRAAVAAAAAIRAAVDACPALSSDLSGGDDDDDDADAVAAWACAGGRRAERAYRCRSVDPEACSALDDGNAQPAAEPAEL